MAFPFPFPFSDGLPSQVESNGPPVGVRGCLFVHVDWAPCVAPSLDDVVVDVAVVVVDEDPEEPADEEVDDWLAVPLFELFP